MSVPYSLFHLLNHLLQPQLHTPRKVAIADKPFSTSRPGKSQPETASLLDPLDAIQLLPLFLVQNCILKSGKQKGKEKLILKSY
jgi:hypothetical protein